MKTFSLVPLILFKTILPSLFLIVFLSSSLYATLDDDFLEEFDITTVQVKQEPRGESESNFWEDMKDLLPEAFGKEQTSNSDLVVSSFLKEDEPALLLSPPPLLSAKNQITTTLVDLFSEEPLLETTHLKIKKVPLVKIKEKGISKVPDDLAQDADFDFSTFPVGGYVVQLKEDYQSQDKTLHLKNTVVGIYGLGLFYDRRFGATKSPFSSSLAKPFYNALWLFREPSETYRQENFDREVLKSLVPFIYNKHAEKTAVFLGNHFRKCMLQLKGICTILSSQTANNELLEQCSILTQANFAYYDVHCNQNGGGHLFTYTKNQTVQKVAHDFQMSSQESQSTVSLEK